MAMKRIEVFVPTVRVRRAVLGFTGWPDAGRVVQHTFEEINEALPTERVAAWNLDGFWQTDSLRPLVSLDHGQIQEMEWPEYDFFLARLPSSENVLLGLGPEPTANWSVFSQELLNLLKIWNCRELCLLGSLYDQVFHDEVLLSGLAQDSMGINQMKDLGLEQIKYSGPAAVHSAIMEEARKSPLRCLGIWAHYPSYLNGPHELLVAGLFQKVGSLLGYEADTRTLLKNWKQRERQIENQIEHNPQLRENLQSVARSKAAVSVSSGNRGKLLRMDEFLSRSTGGQEENPRAFERGMSMTGQHKQMEDYTVAHFQEIARQNRFPENAHIPHDKDMCGICHPDKTNMDPFHFYLKVVTQSIKVRRPRLDKHLLAQMNEDLAMMGISRELSMDQLLHGQEEALEIWKDWIRDALATGLSLLAVHSGTSLEFDLEEAKERGMGDVIESSVLEIMEHQKRNHVPE